MPHDHNRAVDVSEIDKQNFGLRIKDGIYLKKILLTVT